MKKLFLLIIISLFAYSCKPKLSLQDKMFIDDQILLHNSTFGLKHDEDSMRNRTTLLEAYISNGTAEKQANKIIDSIYKELFKHDKNWRYNPASDPHLTFKNFMIYCNQNKYLSPREHAKLLTAKE
jgi:hypothetical protein